MEEKTCVRCDTPLRYVVNNLYPDGIYESKVSQYDKGANHSTKCPYSIPIFGYLGPHVPKEPLPEKKKRPQVVITPGQEEIRRLHREWYPEQYG